MNHAVKKRTSTLRLPCVFLLSALLISTNAASQNTPAEPVIEMEPYIVRGNRILPEPEEWFYVRVPALEFTRGDQVVVVPGYEILSPRGKKNTLVFVEELQLRQLASALLFPNLVEALPRSSIAVFIDDDKSRTGSGVPAWKDDSVYTATALRSPANRPDPRYSVGTHISANLLGSNSVQLPSRYSENANRSLMDESDETANPDTKSGDASQSYQANKTTRIAMNGGPLVAYIDDSGRLLRPGARPVSQERLARNLWQGLNYFAINASKKKVPEWLNVGLSRLFASVVATHKQIDFGRMDFGFAPMTTADNPNLKLKTPSGTSGANFPPASGTASPRYGSHLPKLTDVLTSDRLNIMAREPQLAAAFVHYGLFGDNGKFRSRFFQFVGRLESEPFSEQLFKECFGKTMSSFEAGLATYVQSFAYYKSVQYKGTLPSLPKVLARDATQSEAARLKAEVFVALGLAPGALDELRIAYWRGEREPAMLALLAFLEEHIGSIPRAQKITKSLLELPQAPARAYAVAAKLRLRELGVTGRIARKLAPAESDSVMEFLIKARERGLLNEDLCATLAKLVLVTAAPPDADIAAFINEASRRYPLNRAITAAAAMRPPA